LNSVAARRAAAALSPNFLSTKAAQGHGHGSDARWYQFCNVGVSSRLCIPILGARDRAQFSHLMEGNMAKKAKKAKKAAKKTAKKKKK
jgi:hypothetical protein